MNKLGIHYILQSKAAAGNSHMTKLERWHCAIKHTFFRVAFVPLLKLPYCFWVATMGLVFTSDTNKTLNLGFVSHSGTEPGIINVLVQCVNHYTLCLNLYGIAVTVITDTATDD